MTRSTRALLALLAVVALVAAGCGDDETDVSAGDGGSGDGGGGEGLAADQPLVVVDVSGGFVPVETAFRSLPTLVVYGDGRVVEQGAQILIYPGPALPALFESRLDETGLATVRAALREAGLDRAGVDYGQPPVADAPTTTVTVTLDGTTYTHVADALGIGADPSLTEQQQADRAALAEAVATLTDLRSLVGAEHLSEPAPFAADRVRLWVRPADEAGPVPDDVPPTTVPWPVDAVTLEATPCLAVEGEAAAAVLAALADANELTRFETADGTWAVTARPVLPHEPTCPTG